ncbi:MAG TPA: hypothetical protein VEG30_10730 [Terriglobales bacterium]|nr:hypothetical protein [Terriglobales bacterium]
MKRPVFLLLISSLLCGLGCSNSGSNPQNGAELSTWVRLKAGLNARLTGGKKAILRSSQAKAAAKSYKMQVEMRLHPGDPFITVEEVSCPDKLRMTAKLGDRPMYEAFRIGHTSYVMDQGKWVTSPVPPDVYPCGDNPGASAPWAILNEGRDMSSSLAQLVTKANATVTAGNLVVVNGSPCQEWEVAFGHPGSKPAGGHMGNMRYTICIDTTTQLPAQVVMGTGGILIKYYDWNQPVDITAPL